MTILSKTGLSATRAAILIGAVALSACTAVRVKSVNAAQHPIKLVCIQENPKVIVADFLSVVRQGFDRHGISTEVYRSDKPPEHCEYTLTYTARQTWDLATYLSFAELEIRRGAELVSSGHYHLRNKGGFSLTKWASTASKIDPVMNQMLSGLTGANRT
jgi:hypothetical protein